MRMLGFRSKKTTGPDESLRWPRLVGQFGGIVKPGPGSYQAASLVASLPPIPVVEYTSSGVCPARLE
jgi:hypothetical protein